MAIRQIIVDDFAGDLEYHFRRATLYLVLAPSALFFWHFSAPEQKSAPLTIIFLLGSLALLVKGLFLLRKSSEGLGLTTNDLVALADAAKTKRFSRLPEQMAQILQDFGAGPLLLWPLLKLGPDVDRTWQNPPFVRIFLLGFGIFLFGWLIRRATRGSASGT